MSDASNRSSDVLAWPAGWTRTAPARRERGQFGRHTVARCLRDIQQEVGRMGASNLRIDTALRLRNDGLPYSGQRQPDDPGAVVYWRRHGRPYAIACDAYTTVEANLRAVTLTLAAKRAVERWGTTSAEREYAGYEALPPPSGLPTTPTTTTRPAHDILGVKQTASRDEVTRAFRALALTRHPDRGGTRAEWDEIMNARETVLSGLGLPDGGGR